MSTQKDYVLEIEEFFDDWGVYWSKGHHDPAEFVAVVADYCEYIYGEGGRFGTEDVRQERWRCVPAPAHNSAAVDYLLIPGTGRGTFPVTVVGS